MSEKDKAKNLQRSTKGHFTRCMGAIRTLMAAKREILKVSAAFQDVKKAYDVVLKRHEEYAVYLDDEHFNEAKEWMETVNKDFINLTIGVYDYKPGQTQDVEHQIESNSEGSESDGSASSKASIPSKKKEKKPVTFSLKREKPKLPMLYGDIRKYFIFKSGFKYAVFENYLL